MRVVQPQQMQLGEQDIAAIKINSRSRDDIPKILQGLQHLYTQSTLRNAVFDLLSTHIKADKNAHNGRPAMDLWKVLVMGVLRLDLDWDYDQLHEQVNNHKTIRQMLGHADPFADDDHYALQTIKDNVKLLTPELLDKINQRVVEEGHLLAKKKASQVLHGRCDSFVVKTHVEYPTDIGLLFDAIRRTIILTARLHEAYDLSDWRQYRFNIKQIKKCLRKTQLKKRYQRHSDENIKQQRIRDAHHDYLHQVQKQLQRARTTLQELNERYELNTSQKITYLRIEEYMQHADRQINQIERRVLHGEVIPHDEKVFSIFQPHTEWIVKGKAGVPMELGMRLSIVEDQYQFILHHQVMEKQTDDQVAVCLIAQTQARFADLKTCSFDKGFHSPKNQVELAKYLDVAAIPSKGKPSKKVREHEQSAAFQQARHKHAAVESAINALQVHGLEMCPDHGIEGLKRYVALGILARNLHRLGELSMQRQRKHQARLKRRRVA